MKANIVEMSEATYISRFRKSDFQLAAHVYGRAGRGPVTILSSAVICRTRDNPAQITSQQYADDINVVTSTPAGAETHQAWQRIDALMLKENWVLPVALLSVLWAYAKGLSGVCFNLDGMLILSDAKLEK